MVARYNNQYVQGQLAQHHLELDALRARTSNAELKPIIDALNQMLTTLGAVLAHVEILDQLHEEGHVFQHAHQG